MNNWHKTVPVITNNKIKDTKSNFRCKGILDNLKKGTHRFDTFRLPYKIRIPTYRYLSSPSIGARESLVILVMLLWSKYRVLIAVFLNVEGEMSLI